MAAVYNLTIDQGASFTVSFDYRVNDAATPDAGTPVDLTGYVASMMIRTRVGGAVLASFGPDSGRLVIVGSVIILTLGADVTDTLTRGGVYDIELHRTGDPADVIRLVQGAVVVDLQVTTDA